MKYSAWLGDVDHCSLIFHNFYKQVVHRQFELTLQCSGNVVDVCLPVSLSVCLLSYGYISTFVVNKCVYIYIRDAPIRHLPIIGRPIIGT